jgi:hypothetical protein
LTNDPNWRTPSFFREAGIPPTIRFMPGQEIEVQTCLKKTIRQRMLQSSTLRWSSCTPSQMRTDFREKCKSCRHPLHCESVLY